uniref:DUF19 domain-containing protein n=1 Tax=Strongyloides stercoralis TaxID=6248 RepID=A0A913I448_STRER
MKSLLLFLFLLVSVYTNTLHIVNKREETETFSKHVEKVFDKAGEAISQVASDTRDLTVEGVNKAGESIAGAANTAFEGTKNIAGKIGDSISGAATSLKDGVVSGGEKAIEGAKDIGGAASDKLNQAGDAISGAAISVKDSIVSGGEKTIQGAKDLGNAAADKLSNVGDDISGAAGAAVEGGKNIASKIGDTLSGAANTVKDGVVSGGEAIAEGTKDLKDSAVNSLNDAGESISNTANSAVDGTKNLASDAADAIGSGINNIGSSIAGVGNSLKTAAGSIAHDGSSGSNIPPGEVKCYVCNSNYKDQHDCSSSDEEVLKKYIKKCKKLEDGSQKNEEAVACRKVRQKLGEEKEIISRECAYSLEDLGTKRRTGSMGVTLYTTQCISEDNDKPCNSSSHPQYFSIITVLIFMVAYILNFLKHESIEA